MILFAQWSPHGFHIYLCTKTQASTPMVPFHTKKHLIQVAFLQRHLPYSNYHFLSIQVLDTRYSSSHLQFHLYYSSSRLPTTQVSITFLVVHTSHSLYLQEHTKAISNIYTIQDILTKMVYIRYHLVVVTVIDFSYI